MGNHLPKILKRIKWISHKTFILSILAMLIGILTIGFGVRIPTDVKAADFSTSIKMKIYPDDPEENDNFGFSVAISENTLVVGSISDDDFGSASGSVYVFKRSWTGWSQQAKLNASDADVFDQFGRSVAISGDTIVVGTPFNDDAGDSSGSAYVFTYNGASWNEQAKLTASDASADDHFGWSVGISGDTIVVGAFRNDVPEEDCGAVYVFERDGTSWSEQAKLTDSVTGDLSLGVSVAIEGDTIIAGATGDDDSAINSGAAYIFVRNGESWSQQAKLKASDVDTSDYFGGSVNISGSDVIVGAHGNDDAGDFTGSAYVFTFDGVNWSEQAKLIANDADAGDWFGGKVAISGDSVIIGAANDDWAGEFSGSAYTFSRNGVIWSQQTKLTADMGAFADSYGCSVDISGDIAVVGASGRDDVGFGVGLVFLYTSVPTEYQMHQDMMNKLELDLDTTVSSRASQASVDELSSKIEEIEAFVKKIDVRFLSQLPDKHWTIYHLEISMGGEPLDLPTLESAYGMRYEPGTGVFLEDITSYMMPLDQAGPGHLRVWVNIPDGEPFLESDYSMFQFNLTYGDVKGTIMVINDFYKEP